MTQITREELMDAIAPRVAGSLASPWETIGMIALFLAGLALGRMRKRPGN